jgi:hypothetical protein
VRDGLSAGLEKVRMEFDLGAFVNPRPISRFPAILSNDGDLGKTLSVTQIETEAIDFLEHIADQQSYCIKVPKKGIGPAGGNSTLDGNKQEAPAESRKIACRRGRS